MRACVLVVRTETYAVNIERQAVEIEPQVVRWVKQVLSIAADFCEPRAQLESLCHLDAQEHGRDYNVDEQES